jgi:uncharacterized membrane protein HdeD (DUF308 family)
MWKYPIEENLFEKFSKYSKITGVIFVILGIIGIVEPAFMTLATVTFVAWLMMFAGLMAAYFTYLSNKEDIFGWLKSFVLIAIALFMIFYPMSGVGTVGLLLAIYFFMDAFAGFSLALSMRPAQGWVWWLINSIFSMLIGVLFVIGWPLTSLYLIGLLVGFSLFFDGISLLITGSIFKKMTK